MSLKHSLCGTCAEKSETRFSGIQAELNSVKTSLHGRKGEIPDQALRDAHINKVATAGDFSPARTEERRMRL